MALEDAVARLRLILESEEAGDELKAFAQGAVDEFDRLDKAARDAGEGGFGDLGESTSTLREKFQGVLDVGFKLQGTFEAVRSALTLVAEGMKLATSVTELDEEANRKLGDTLEFVLGRNDALVQSLQRRADIGKLATDAVAEATAELERQTEVDKELRSELGLVREEHIQFAKDLERQLEIVGDNEVGLKLLQERAAEYRDRLEELGVVVPQIIEDTANLATETEGLTAVQEHQAQIAQEAADAQEQLNKQLAAEEAVKKARENYEKLTQELERFIQKSKDGAREVAEAFEDAFAPPERRETEAFREREENIKSLEEQLLELQGQDIIDPVQIDELERQLTEAKLTAVEQFEDIALSAEETAKRQAKAQQEVTEFIAEARDTVAEVADNYEGLDETAVRTLENLVDHIEFAAETGQDLTVPILEYQHALERLKTQAGVDFQSLADSQKKAAEEGAALAENMTQTAISLREVDELSGKVEEKMSRIAEKANEVAAAF